MIPKPPVRQTKKPAQPVSYAFRAHRLGLDLSAVPIGPSTTSDRTTYAYGGTANTGVGAALSGGDSSSDKNNTNRVTPTRTASASTSRRPAATNNTTNANFSTPRGQKTTGGGPGASSASTGGGKYTLSKPIRAMKAAEQYRQFLSKEEQHTLTHAQDADRGQGSVYYLGAASKFQRKSKHSKAYVGNAAAPVITEVVVKKPTTSPRRGSNRKQIDAATTNKKSAASAADATTTATAKSTEKQENKEVEKKEVVWNHRDHINFRYEILSNIEHLAGDDAASHSGGGVGGAAFLCFDYKTEKNVSISLVPLTPEEEDEAKSSANLGRFGAHHLIYSPEERFIYRHHLATVTVADPQLLQIVRASSEYTPPSNNSSSGKTSGEEVNRCPSFPLKKVFKEWGDFLSPYEQEEIKGYEGQIYFLGPGAPKIQAPSPTTKAATPAGGAVVLPPANKAMAKRKDTTLSTGSSDKSPEKKTKKGDAKKGELADAPPPQPSDNNYGYDDEEKMYRTVIGDHMAYRYEVLGELGKGSFGQVLRCKDHAFPDGRMVGLKIIKNEERFNIQAIVEVRLLDRLRRQKSSKAKKEQQDGIVQLLHHFKFRSHVCLVFEVCGMNLYELQKERNYSGFTLDEVKVFSLQILTGMKTIEKENIIHCDLKPENILLMNNDSPLDGLRVIDYGSGCYNGEQIYSYIQSRFYRAPEIMLGASPYTAAIDVWSFGCIVCEMIMGYPIFPGETELDQMQRICQVVPPDDDDSFDFLASCPRAGKFFHQNGEVRGAHKDTYSIDEVLYSQSNINDPVFVDFLSQCLTWDPELRATPKELLKHDFLKGLTNPTKRARLKRKQQQQQHSGSGSLGTSLTTDQSDGSLSTTLTSMSQLSLEEGEVGKRHK